MKRRIVWSLASLVLVAAVALLPRLLHPQGAAATYETAAVTSGPIEATVTASGTLRPMDEVEVGSAVSGRVLRVRADWNSIVARGQVLAEIDPSSFEARVAQFAAAAARARATLQQAEFDLKRQSELAESLLVARADLERAGTARAQAAADLQQVEAQLASARVDLANTIIRAPMDGVVLSRQVEEGQTVAASLQSPTLFLIARDLSDMQLETSVDEADIGRVSAGMPVRFTVDAWPGTSFTGTVRQVRLESTTTSGVVTYTVVIRARNEDGRLRPGMTADVAIVVARSDTALAVPNAALRVTGADVGIALATTGQTTGAAAVFVLREGRPQRVSVTLGFTNGTATTVTAGGLRAGDAVITQATAGTAPPAGAATASRGAFGGFGPPAGLGRKRS